MTDLEQARANIAAAEQAEKSRIDKLVREASKQTEVWAAEQALAKRQAEQEQEAAQQARAAQQEATAREDAQRSYLSAGGRAADFDAWYVVERQRLVNDKIASERRRAELSYRQSF